MPRPSLLPVSLTSVVLVLVASWAGTPSAQPKSDGTVTTAHGVSMYGDLKYAAGFRHFAYANPQAPKGGDVKLAAIGTYDNLNPFILKGVAAAGLGETFDTLMLGSADEPFSEYGLIAETIEMPADRSWVAFTLRPEAKFHDGSPITVDDVIWTFETLKTKGHPFYRSYYRHVVKAEKTGGRKVRFTFDQGENRELPLIVGQMSVMSKAHWSKREFEKTTLEPVLGSGAYKVESVEAGRSIVFRRVKDYWAAKLPVNAGRDNFDAIRFDYYRDTNVALEAFKAGQYDFRQENVAKNWATAYTGPAVAQGLVKREEIKHEVPTGMQAYVFNERRPMFQDRRVREALLHAFDFEWTNKQLFFGAYTRTKSYFSNSELAARGLPAGDELQLLEPFRGKVPDEVFAKEYDPPKSDGSGNIREQLRRALELLGQAGWTVKGQKLVNARGEPMQFEVLLSDPTWERISLPFAKTLERLGIQARVRTVDSAQYQNRMDSFDFDMTVAVWGQSLSPGNEQRDFWHSASAGTNGSRNFAGIKDPVVDRLIDLVIAAPDRPSLVARTRALDRVLLWGHHTIPHWHIQSYRVAYWDKFSRPATSAKYSLSFDTWWIDAKKAAALDRKKSAATK
ncbi:MAG: ABC transporter substrate-binding protein [Candidatus Rokubacteria bacterium]|nr:ABC transporter substrate-binding protein [Candidatus Rokubacteria bacterium]